MERKYDIKTEMTIWDAMWRYEQDKKVAVVLDTRVGDGVYRPENSELNANAAIVFSVNEPPVAVSVSRKATHIIGRKEDIRKLEQELGIE